MTRCQPGSLVKDVSCQVSPGSAVLPSVCTACFGGTCMYCVFWGDVMLRKCPVALQTFDALVAPTVNRNNLEITNCVC